MKLDWRNLVTGDEFFMTKKTAFHSKVTEKYSFSNWVSYANTDAVMNAFEHKTGIHRVINVDDQAWNEWYSEWLSWNPALPTGVEPLSTYQRDYPSEFVKEPTCDCGAFKTYGDKVDISFHYDWCKLVKK